MRVIIVEDEGLAAEGLNRVVGAVADVAPFVEIFEAQTGQTLTYFELTAAIAFQAFGGIRL